MLLIKLSLVCYVQMIPPYPFPHLEQAQRIKLLYKKISWDWTHTGTRAKTWPLSHMWPSLLLRHYFLALAIL